MKKLRVGVVGVGYLGKFHAEKYANTDDTELVAVADIDKLQAKNIAKKYDTIAYTDYNELKGKVDAVSIVVPTSLHFEVGSFFLSNNISVFMEKPIATTLKEADELIKISRKNNTALQVGHIERFNPVVAASEKIIENPMFIESHRLCVYNERGTDVSVILDLMIHDIDIIASMVNSDIKEIRSSGARVVSDYIDIANARIEFENGCIANLTASRISIKNQRKFRIFQKNRYISLDLANGEITDISLLPGESNEISPIPGTLIKKEMFEKSDALKDEIRAFIDTVLYGKPCKVSGEDGRKALKIALAVTEHLS